jgi:hypothetical protein
VPPLVPGTLSGGGRLPSILFSEGILGLVFTVFINSGVVVAPGGTRLNRLSSRSVLRLLPPKLPCLLYPWRFGWCRFFGRSKSLRFWGSWLRIAPGIDMFGLTPACVNRSCGDGFVGREHSFLGFDISIARTTPIICRSLVRYVCFPACSPCSCTLSYLRSGSEYAGRRLRDLRCSPVLAR